MPILSSPTTDAAERWHPIPDCPGYEASDQGRVRSVDRTTTNTLGVAKKYRGRVIKPFPNTVSGRAQVRLSFGPTQRTYLVTALVLAAFVGPRPGDGYDACHNNGDPLDDRLDNLRWDTHSENMLDVIRHGRHNHAGKTHCKNGHPYDEKNTITSKDGRRSCRICVYAAIARYEARKAAESAPRDADGNPLPPEPKKPYRKANPVSSQARLERTRARNAAKRAAEQAAGGPSPDQLEARRKYQREYMRARRARKAAEGATQVA